jgi:hypothetical protein
VARVFISHASADLRSTDTVFRWLVAAGHDVFLDRDSQVGIAPGEAWEDRLHERLRWADATVAVVTSTYVQSTWCTAEVAIARNRGAVIIPVSFEAGVEHPLLSSVQRLDATTNPTDARNRLVERLYRIDNTGGTMADGASPYPGLEPFGIERNRVFFGREADVKELCADLRSSAGRAETVVHLLVGPSGCGIVVAQGRVGAGGRP